MTPEEQTDIVRLRRVFTVIQIANMLNIAAEDVRAAVWTRRGFPDYGPCLAGSLPRKKAAAEPKSAPLQPDMARVRDAMARLMGGRAA